MQRLSRQHGSTRVHLLIGAEATKSGGGGVCRATASARSLTKFVVFFAPAKDDELDCRLFSATGFSQCCSCVLSRPVVAVLKGHGSE